MDIKVNNYLLRFSTEVLNTLKNYIQCNESDPESGGILLGRITPDLVLIQRLSVPTELDKRSRFNFDRHRLSAQIVIDYEYVNSSGQVTYLGEWHTHPEDEPSPSRTDIKMIKQQFSQNKIHTEFLILLIQGRRHLSIYLLDKSGIHSTKINIGTGLCK